MSDPGRRRFGNPERVVPQATSEPTLTSQGMIASVNDFVDSAGNLTAVSYRFLYSLFADIQQLKQTLGPPVTGGNFSASRRALNPIATANSTTVIMLGAGFVFTPPANTTRLLIVGDWVVYNTAAGFVVISSMYLGTGGPPLPGAPFPSTNGRVIGSQTATTVAQANGYAQAAGCAIVPVTSQPYWVDVGLSVSGGLAGCLNIDLNAIGLID